MPSRALCRSYSCSESFSDLNFTDCNKCVWIETKCVLGCWRIYSEFGISVWTDARERRSTNQAAAARDDDNRQPRELVCREISRLLSAVSDHSRLKEIYSFSIRRDKRVEMRHSSICTTTNCLLSLTNLFSWFVSLVFVNSDGGGIISRKHLPLVSFTVRSSRWLDSPKKKTNQDSCHAVVEQ